jgi:nitroimidazol reductase NimA-like FMN-containing flavoprotein (pyridoxamine 5'-phosphate oxidase superfamily)
MALAPVDYTPPDRIGKLTDSELDEFLAAPWNARLATITPADSPYIVPVWFEFDSDDRVFYVIARSRSAYVDHIQYSPAVAMHIADDVHLEHTRVLVEGTAEILAGPVVPEDNDRLRDMVVRMSRKYMGEPGPEYAERTMSRPRYFIRITPIRWQSWTGREWAPRYREE